MTVLNLTQRLHMACTESFFYSCSASLNKGNASVCQGLLISVSCVVEQSKQVH